ncbi:GNAT family N-acetyltransferase [Salinisphaera hydrothermalis]|uniref:GNAT family N-acetyltransferase n=1 Tax=Salinisphaera hydrothermalis TaxID=563188 RepID=UPI00334135EF
MHSIRIAEATDWRAIWSILSPVFAAGETYAYSRDIDEAGARAAWMDKPSATFVGVDARGEIVATYYIVANQPGQGAHVANCGYVVSEAARGQGWASAMCEHSQHEARARGFRAMQYNFVAETNEGAVRLWQKHGFEIVGRLPGAFCHPRLGDIDALVMYKSLASLNQQ